MDTGLLRIIALVILIMIFGSDLVPVNRQIQQPVPGGKIEISTENVKQYEPSVVTISGHKNESDYSPNQNPLIDLLNLPYFDRSYVTIGTGFFVSKSGYILTNKHVVDDQSVSYKVTMSDGQKYNVINIIRDNNNDIAVLQIDIDESKKDELKPLSLGNSSNLKTGDAVATIGTNPKDFKKDIKVGSISGLGYRVIADNPYQNDSERLNNAIQTNLNLVPGNSGSPLINSNGEVVGINTATASTFSNVSFAIPINPAKQFLENVSN
jgi:S1-C subfamily serine protease